MGRAGEILPPGENEALMPGRWLKLLTAALVAAAGLAAFLGLTFTRTRLGRAPHPAVAPLVEVSTARPTRVPVVVRAMGGVRPARSVRLLPQVSGRVIQVSPRLLPGGQVRAGEVLVRIDPADYALAVRQARGAVAEAQLALDLELGHSAVARRELQLVKDTLQPSPERRQLASRESYVENARAQLDAARSRLERAQLDLGRATLRAPFDARVSDRQVDVGQVVTTQSVLATLVASDEVWIEATLPVEQLRWLDLPREGEDAGARAAAVVRQQLAGGQEVVRQGRVLGLLPGLQDQGKLARVLVSVAHPFASGAQPAPAAGGEAPAPRLPLLVGSYVQVELSGRPLSDLFALPRAALREEDKVWVRGADGTLSFRSVEVVWSRGETAYVRGDLRAGEAVVRSRLTSPVPGMKVSLATAAAPPAPRAAADGGQPGRRPPAAAP